MCGIAGFLNHDGKRGSEELGDIVTSMTTALRHRGPDGAGHWVDAAAGSSGASVALGHRRLAIIDVSEAGHQPMTSASGRFIITFNGEIYNFQELRAELEASGSRFRGHSDTEVLVEGCGTWGVERLVRRLVGMFAFAVWDREMNWLTLVRDQVGIKPLYWGRFGDLLMFGSELKALTAHPDCPAEIDRDSAASFMRFGYMPTPFSIYRGIHKLPSGSLLHVTPGREPELSVYWDARSVAASGVAGRDGMDERDALERLETLLADAVKRQMISDVPLGAFLSGGIDSSLVTALAQASSDQPVRTFSIGFAEPEYDEAPFARAIAKHLGTDHTELYLGPTQLLDTVPKLAHYFDEPFADASQLATLVLSEMTRKHVTVALSGDGGDELFAGYSHHYLLSRLWRQASKMPHAAQKAVAWSVLNLPGWVYSGVRALSTERPGQVPWPNRVVRTSTSQFETMLRRCEGV
jgi:asparagine synthase (glutamine-hydrolysing)